MSIIPIVRIWLSLNFFLESLPLPIFHGFNMQLQVAQLIGEAKCESKSGRQVTERPLNVLSPPRSQLSIILSNTLTTSQTPILGNLSFSHFFPLSGKACICSLLIHLRNGHI